MVFQKRTAKVTECLRKTNQTKSINAREYPILNFHFFLPLHTFDKGISFNLNKHSQIPKLQVVNTVSENDSILRTTKDLALIFHSDFVIFVLGYDPNKQPIIWSKFYL